MKTKRQHLHVEALDQRLVPTRMVVAHDLLLIDGELNHANQIRVDPVGTTKVKVTITANGTTETGVFRKADFTSMLINGGLKADTITNNTSVRSHIYGLSGNDTLCGGSNQDWLYGGDNEDHLSGRAQKDILLGEHGNDTLCGGSNNDSLAGGIGNDVLLGEAGRDTLRGLQGDDWLDAGSTSFLEVVDGGTGYDHNALKWADDGTTADDVRQGGRGTCVFLSALSGAAGHGYNLRDRISYRGNFVYAVTLYNSETGKACTELVNFNGSLTNLDARQKVEGEFWVNLFERAYVQLANRIDSGWFDGDYLEAPGTAMYALTKRRVLDHNEDNMTSTPQKIRDALLAKKIVTAGHADDTSLIHANHSYTVQRVWKNSAGEWMICLRNPWGQDNNSSQMNTTTGVGYQGDPWDGVIEMTWRDFINKHDFDRLTVS